MTAGEGGFWSEFDWNAAFELSEQFTGLDHSGHYDSVETEMYWPTTHMVQPVGKSAPVR